MSTNAEQPTGRSRNEPPDATAAVRADDHDRRDDGPNDDRTGSHVAMDRHTVVQREKESFGGIKWGSAFFGWLTATGTAVLLTALLAGAGAALGIATDTDPNQAANQASQKADTIGIASGIALLVVLLIAYYCGGYVAGRMARFNGAKQGIAVWVWAIVIAVVVAIAGALLGSEFDVLARLNGFPRIPVDEGTLTTGGIIAIVAALATALIGAILGGLAGMRFHRKVDKAGLGH
jgi:hypothetical protein